MEQARAWASPLAARAERHLVLLTTLGCLVIWIARRPEQLTRPYVWDEEGLIIRHFLDGGFIGALGPVQGYFILPSTLLLPVAKIISFTHLPLTSYVFATGVFLATVLLLLVPDSRWGNRSTRALMALAMALCPAQPEVVGVLLYSFWWAALWPAIVLGWRRDVWWCRVPALVIGGLSSPAGAAMVVPWAISWHRTRRRGEAVGTAILGLAVVLQAVAMLTSERVGPTSHDVLRIAQQTGKTITLFVLSADDLSVRSLVIVGSVVLVGLGVAAAREWRDRGDDAAMLLFLALLIVTVLDAVPTPLKTRPDAGGPRYYFLPFVLLAWLLLYLWRETGGPSRLRVGAAVILLAALLTLPWTFQRPKELRTGRLDWRTELAHCSWSTASTVVVPIYYDGSAERLWQLEISPAECREQG